MTAQQREETTARGAQAQLERAYIEQYLNGLGYTLDRIVELPEEQSRELMRAASLYASLHLTEVEARAHLVEEIHGGPTPM